MTKECACGLATIELVLDIKRILDNIKKSEIRNEFIHPSTIDMLTGYTGRALENAEEIEQFCGIRITNQKDSLKISQMNMRNINSPYIKNLIKENLENSVVSIRNTMHQCKTFNK